MKWVNLQLDQTQASLFFQVNSQRYDNSSAPIITSNKAFSDWAEVFAGDAIMASAALDRLLHCCTAINIRGESYRLKDRRKAGLFPRTDEEARPAPFPSSDTLQNGPRRQGFAAPRKPRAPLTAPGRSGNAS